MSDTVEPPIDLKKTPFTRQELLEQLDKERNLEIQIRKAKCGSDLYLFNKYVLTPQEGQNKVPLADFHKEICHFVQNRRDRKKLLLVPRGHLKSTLVTVGYSVFRIVENKNIRILILSATWQMAVDFLTEIKKHLKMNETLIETYGDLTEGNLEWSQDRVTLNRTDTGIKGPTVWAAGIDTNLVGAHPDIIIMDDVVNRESADSDESMRKIITHYKDALDLLEPGGQLIVIGTRWNDRDLYEWILNPDNNVKQNFDLMVRGAFKTDFNLSEVFNKKEGGESLVTDYLWPEKFNFKELSERYWEKGPYEFSSQYLNDPVPDEAAVFRKDWFRYIQKSDWLGRPTSRFITIDPAISMQKEADSTAITVVEVDGEGYILPIHIENLKIAPDKLIDLTFRLAEMYHPLAIGVELNAFQKVLQYSLNEEMRKRNRNLPIVELKVHDRSKDERIRALQPLYANGKILHSKEVKNLDLLEEQLLRFPRGRHDDIIDALASTLELIVPPRRRVDEDFRPNQHYLYGNRR